MPTCPICGGCHYKYACWKNPDRKNALRSHFKGVEARKTKKKVNNTFTAQDARKDLIYKLDLVVSKYVRQYYADKNGICTCYTCGKRLPWKGMDCGHCISRRFTNTRFELDNLRCQCQFCNRNLHGNYEVYYPKLRKELGQQRFDELWQMARGGDKISTVELEVLLNKYKNMLKNLAK